VLLISSFIGSKSKIIGFSDSKPNFECSNKIPGTGIGGDTALEDLFFLD